MPDWLSYLSLVSLAVAIACSAWCAFDILAGHRQHMMIMNLVWPITMLWSGPMGLYAYYKVGRQSTHAVMKEAHARGEKPPGMARPQWQSTGVAATHCGAGCTLGDFVAEWFIYFAATSAYFGWNWELFGRTIFTAWIIDFIAAFAFGILFQYFTIKPMKGLSPGEGLIAAIKADALSLTAWQVGMYGWMAIATFAIFGEEIPKTSPVFWFMMQIAMLAGFVTSYPVNWWLLSRGIKEKM